MMGMKTPKMPKQADAVRMPNAGDRREEMDNSRRKAAENAKKTGRASTVMAANKPDYGTDILGG